MPLSRNAYLIRLGSVDLTRRISGQRQALLPDAFASFLLRDKGSAKEQLQEERRAKSTHVTHVLFRRGLVGLVLRFRHLHPVR